MFSIFIASILVMLVVYLWWLVLSEYRHYRRINVKVEPQLIRIEERHIRVETLADSPSAVQWMDDYILHCRANRIHCPEDKDCGCWNCGFYHIDAQDIEKRGGSAIKFSAEEIKRLTTVPNIMGDVSGTPIKGDRLEHNGSKWTLVHADYNADGSLRFREEPMVFKPTNIPIGKKKCIHCAVPLHFKRQSDVCIHCRRKELFGESTVPNIMGDVSGPPIKGRRYV